MKMKYREYSGKLNASGMHFGIVVSRFNSLFTEQLLKGALDCLERHGVEDNSASVVWVPGANEIPQAIGNLASSGGFDALIALGAVVRGATQHADLINNQVARSLAGIALDRGLPVINGVVAAETLEQAIERSGTKSGNKGWDAALAAVEMASVFHLLKT